MEEYRKNRSITWILFLLLILDFSRSVIGDSYCNPCPGTKTSGCLCEYHSIDCSPSHSNRNITDFNYFPQFINNSAHCSVRIDIHGYNFESIPNGSFPLGPGVNVTNLNMYYDLSMNEIAGHAFDGLKNTLAQLSIHKCGLDNFHPQTFNNFTKLTSLDLSSNFLLTIPAYSFLGCNQLIKMDLSGNIIFEISNESFVGLTNLKSLDLSQNEIYMIDSHAFSQLTQLTSLNLDKNKITVINSYAFANTQLSSLGLSFDVSIKKPTIKANAFAGLDYLEEINVAFGTDNDYYQSELCFSNTSAVQSCNWTGLSLQTTTVCKDLFNWFNCATKLTLNRGGSSNVCLPYLHILSNLQNLTVNYERTANFNLTGLPITSLIMKPHWADFCDTVLDTVPNLEYLYFTSLHRSYVPYELSKMDYLKTLVIRYPPSIYCNCSQFWLYNFTKSVPVDTSRWSCVHNTYSNVRQFLLSANARGLCKGNVTPYQPPRSYCAYCGSINNTTSTTNWPWRTTSRPQTHTWGPWTTLPPPPYTTWGPPTWHPTTYPPYSTTGGPFGYFKIFLEEIDNSAGGGFLADGQTHCDDFWFTGKDLCDMNMRICVEPSNRHPAYYYCSTEWILLGQISTNLNKVSFTTQQYGGWSNPMMFQGSSFRQGFQIKIMVFDADKGRNQLIGGFLCQPIYPMSKESATSCSTTRGPQKTPLMLKFGYIWNY